MGRTWAEHVANLLSYCGLVDTRISASEKDLPVADLCIFSDAKKIKGSLLKGCWVEL